MPRYSFLGRPLKADPDAEAQSEKLHKMLATAGLGSRREMEALIETGAVTLNGETAKVADRVKPGDQVRVKGRPVKLVWEESLPKVLIYHKPEGEIVSRDDPDGRPSVFNKLPRLKGQRWISIGRLDFNTEGLLIFTTSGELANRLSHPRYEVEREYAVRVLGELTQEHMDQLTQGIELDDGTAYVDKIYAVGVAGQGLALPVFPGQPALVQGMQRVLRWHLLARVEIRAEQLLRQVRVEAVRGGWGGSCL